MAKREKYTLDYVKKNLGSVEINHYRRPHRSTGYQDSLWPVHSFYDEFDDLVNTDVKGGKTVVIFCPKKKSMEVVAESVCSNDSVFNKKLGVRVALLRALKAAGLAYKKNRTIYIANPAYNKNVAAKHRANVIKYLGNFGPVSKYDETFYPGRWIKVRL